MRIVFNTLKGLMILLFAIVVLAGLVWSSWFIKGTDVAFQSSDGKWSDREVQFKGRDFKTVVTYFEGYRIKCKAPYVTMQRTTLRPEKAHWFDNYSDAKWAVPYQEPYSHLVSGVYPPNEPNHCSKKALSPEQRKEARRLAMDFIDKITHNKSLNTDTGDPGAG